ncbi:maleylpyruvate isomerase family mycothiol-dependent enzyme [Streptomyces hygroscopicus]|uniref:maleylpyruvate isomerase family mycothiol-dependent enzyme n=1 Tax=Streptomyces hygroscopicus TaxID=1912 RepID=UPI0036372D8C
MDYSAHFHREILAFEQTARGAADGTDAPLIPSCPGWTMSDLVLHLGGVHRLLARVIQDRLTEQPDVTDITLFDLPEDHADWPQPTGGPHHGPVPVGLVDWFAEGAARLEALFRSVDPRVPVWTWSAERTAGFWLRMQTIEAALHRWDAEQATGRRARPVEPELAVDAVTQTFEVMAPARRTWREAPAGAGERFRFRRTDGPGLWTVRFDGDDIHLTTGATEEGATAEDAADGGTADPACDVELAGTASDLMLYLWQRIPAERLDEVTGDRAVLDRYFTLVPPV